MVRPTLSVARKYQSAMQPSANGLPRGMGRQSAAHLSRSTNYEEDGTPQGPEVTRQRVVWIANEGGHPYSKAKHFGRLMPLTTGNVNYFNLDRLMVGLAPKLRSASADDYLLISGSPVIVGLIMSMWLARFGKVNLLQWSQSKDKYIEIVLLNEAVERMATDGQLAS